MPKIAFSLSAKTTGSLPSRKSRMRSIGCVGRPDLVHRILADEQRAVGRGGDLAGILHGRHGGDQADLEPVGHLGHGGDTQSPRRRR